MDQMVDSGQWVVHLNGVPEPVAVCTVDQVGVARQALPGWGPGHHTNPTPTPSRVVLIPPARKGGPPRGDWAGLGGGCLQSSACCGGGSRRWGSGPKRATARGQQRDRRGWGEPGAL